MTQSDHELDRIDEQLISELQRDPRASYSELARTVRLSSVAVASRVKRLRDRGLILISAIIEPDMIGHGTAAAVMVEVNGPAAEVAAAIADFDESTFVALTSGRTAIHVEIRCADDQHLVSALDAIRAVSGVSAITVLVYLEVLKEYTSPPRSKERVEFDDIDHQLIGLLQQDGRAGYAALAEHVDMSASTVAHRVNRLVSSGAVVIVTTVADGLGPRLVHAGIACRTSSAAREVAAELSLLDGCTFIAATSGPFDIAITATVADRGALLTLADRCRLTAGVAQLETFEYLSIVKEDYRRVDVRVVDPATPHAATA